jgi:zinc protease
MNARFFFAALLVAGALAISHGSAPAADLAGLPPAGEPHRPVLARPQEKTLTNGLRVIVVERPGLPLLRAEVLIKSGAEADPPPLSGLAHFTAELLRRGTTTRNATQLALEIESLGAKIESEARWDSTAIKLDALSANAAPALAILADLVRHPAFAPAEIERARREALDDLRLALEEPGTIARFTAARAALGRSVYGHPKEGTPASLSRVGGKDILKLHERAYRPANTLLVLVGNVTAPEAFALAEKTFGDWTAPASTDTPAPTPAPFPAPRILLIDMPNAGQAGVYLAAPGIARDAADYFAGKVASALLGGGYSSRLNQEIRLKRGLSYGAQSALETWRSSGVFAAWAQTKNESAAEVVQLIQTEIQRLATEPVPADYLLTRQAVLSGSFARDLETNEGCAKRIGELALYDLPLDTLGQYLDQVDEVRPADLQTFAEKHFASAAFTIVVAGQAKKVADPLRAIFPKLEVIPLAALDLESPELRKPARR